MAATTNTPGGIEVFVSYAHKDEAVWQELEKHLALLRRQGVITTWYDRQITSGSEWSQEIDTHLTTAQIILLLISADFLASDYCYGIELQRAMARHAARNARVIPIILRPVDWRGASFGKLQALPKDAKPVALWGNVDEAFADIALGILRAIEDMSAPTTSASASLNPERTALSEGAPPSESNSTSAISGGQRTSTTDAIGDRIDARESQGFINRPGGPVTQTFGPQRMVDTGGGDYAEGNIDKRQGAFVSGGTIYGPVVGSNSGTMMTSYGSSSPLAGASVTLDEVLVAVRQGSAAARHAGNEDLADDLGVVVGQLEAALKAEQGGKVERRAAKLREGQESLRTIVVGQPGLADLVQMVDRVR